MKKLHVAAVTLAFGAALSAAGAVELGRYGSRAALIGHPQQLTIGVLAAPQPASLVAAMPMSVSPESFNTNRTLLQRDRLL